MALLRRKTPVEPEPEPVQPVEPARTGPAKKDRPTPTRKEAEALRRQRVTRTMTTKEARLEERRLAREQRLRTMSVRESVPEKVLLRDYVDSRRNIGEFLLPSLVVILAVTFLSSVLPSLTLIATVVMYLFIFIVLLDCALMWRGFKKELARRLPKASPRGLLMYGVNRSIQIRKFRIPPPRVKRGESF